SAFWPTTRCVKRRTLRHQTGPRGTEVARRLLDKRDWDFPSSCWVCEPGNDHGLQVPFYLDEEARQVVAEFTPQPFHSGAPEFAHGGLSMALLDEGMTWALISIA